MATKSKSLVTKVVIDKTKPLVKEFANKDDSVLHYIETMLPHQPNSKIKVSHLFASKDNKFNKYRVNWYTESNEGLTSQKKITVSKYIQIETVNNEIKLTDLTIKR